ncbi:MAG: hypothetical protein VW757_11700, partial [Halieaceae bacterium]
MLSASAISVMGLGVAAWAISISDAMGDAPVTDYRVREKGASEGSAATSHCRPNRHASATR